MIEITGTSVCLLYRDSVVSILRDNIPTIQYPNHWDFPGGQVERYENAVDAGLREVYEETGLVIDQQNIIWDKDYEFEYRSGAAKFLVARLVVRNVLQLGNEGQAVRLMTIEEFFEIPNVVPAQQQRLGEFLLANEGSHAA